MLSMAFKRTRQGDAIQQQHFCSPVPSCTSDAESFLSLLESLVRRIVREELERDRSLRQSAVSSQLTGTSGPRLFRLCFTNGMQQTYFTNSNILSEDDVPVKIALFDATSQSIVTYGRLSSLKIEICVLDADFGSNDGTEENWTSDEFNANILIPRQGKARLLSGESFITLKNGEGCISKMMFTDNSSWVRNRKFKLGAKVMNPSAIEEDIKEAISDPFMVKDKRGEARKKRDRPSLNDHIWRLKKIAKGGKIHNWLSSQGIHTVKDLLRFHAINPSLFHKKYSDMPTKSWEAIMDHARTCVIDEKETTEQPLDGQNYCHPDSLNLERKHLVKKAKLQAYKNVNNMIPLDETSTLPWASPQAGPAGAANQGPGQADKQEGGDLWSELMEMPQYSPPSGGGFFSAEMCIEGGDVWSLGGLQVPSEYSFVPCAASMEQASTGLCFASGDGAGSSNAQYSCFPNSTVHVSGKAQCNNVAWRKVRAALKWVLLWSHSKRAKLEKYTIVKANFY